MKIAHLLSHAGLNGVATSLHTLIQAQLRAGHEILLVHPTPSWIELQPFDRPVTTFTSHFPTTISELSRVGHLIRDWGEDVVHTHGSRANKFGMTYRLVAGTPTVMTAHARLFQIPWRFAHVVIAPSVPTAKYYRKRFLVADSSLTVVPHLFDVDPVVAATPATRAAARAELGLSPDAFVVGSVGEICDRKNQIDMLRILKRLVGKGVNAHLLLVGRMIQLTEAALWAEMASDPQIADRIHLVGQRADAVRLIHAMDVYLCTSKIEEGPVATLEAMASGVAVATVDVGYTSELLHDGENGRMFPMGAVDEIADACAALSSDPALRDALGDRARATVASFLTADRIIPQVDAVYRQALSRSGRKAVAA